MHLNLVGRIRLCLGCRPSYLWLMPIPSIVCQGLFQQPKIYQKLRKTECELEDSCPVCSAVGQVKNKLRDIGLLNYCTVWHTVVSTDYLSQHSQQSLKGSNSSPWNYIFPFGRAKSLHWIYSKLQHSLNASKCKSCRVAHITQGTQGSIVLIAHVKEF